MKLVITSDPDALNYMALLVEHPDVHIWHLDLMWKYYEMGWVTYDDSGIGVTFLPTDRSEALGFTDPVVFEIEDIEGDPWEWNVLAGGGRYEVRIAVYRHQG